MAGTEGVGLLDQFHLVDVGLVEKWRADPLPSPGIIRRAGGPPKVTEPTESTAATRTRRCHWRKKRAQPIRVPVVPAPTNSTSRSGKSRGIAGAVRRMWARQLPGFWYWFSHTKRSSEAHISFT